MDTSRLANVIFNKGKKIPQTRYSMICEHIENDMFTLDEYVLDYKLKESFLGKVPYKLLDGTNVIISSKTIQQLNTINIDKKKLEEFMSLDYKNFKKLIEVIANGDK